MFLEMPYIFDNREPHSLSMLYYIFRVSEYADFCVVHFKERETTRKYCIPGMGEIG